MNILKIESRNQSSVEGSIWEKAGPMYEEFKKISDTNNNPDLQVRTLKWKSKPSLK